MYIEKLEIIDNRRLMVRGINELVVDFTHQQQLILGTNGCGKSTVMAELTPLPANGRDYLTNGYKRITLNHLNKTYILTSLFNTAAGTHSFFDVTESVELNDGGTQKIQRKLVKEHFAYDQELHDVLSDQVRFTDMSPIQRRDWLTKISGTNLDDVIALFNRLKKTQRAKDSVAQHFNKRLFKESTDVLDDAALNELSADFSELDSVLKRLYQARKGNVIGEPDEHLEAIRSMVDKSKRLVKRLHTLGAVNNPYKLKSKSELDKEINLNSERVHGCVDRINKLYADYTEVNDLIKNMGGDRTPDEINDVKQSLNRIEAKLAKEPDDLLNSPQLKLSKESLQYYHGISNQLVEIVDALEDNSDGRYTKEKYDTCLNAQATLENQIIEKTERFEKIRHTLDHINQTDDSVCPKCNHTFKLGAANYNLDEMAASLKTLDAEIKSLESKRSNVVNEINAHDKYQHALNNYHRFMGQINRGLIKQIHSAVDLTKVSPVKITEMFNQAQETLARLADLKVIIDERDRLRLIVEAIDAASGDGKYTKKRLEQISDEIEAEKQRQIELETIGHTLNDVNKHYHKSVEIARELEELNGFVKVAMRRYIDDNQQLVIEKAITETSLELGEVNKKLLEAKNKQAVITDVTESRDEAVKESEAIKVLIETLNPNTGIIGEYLEYFIKQFVEQMNIILNNVWEHSFSMLPCEVNKEGVTYKFPLQVNHAKHGPPDISKGSNSQVSMINFAFKIVVMTYLGLDDYPLYLDELAPDLDERHRVNILNFVRDYVESKRCSQMFLVSHYASGHGAFVHAEVMVMDEENIINLPGDYNNHVSIVRNT